MSLTYLFAPFVKMKQRNRFKLFSSHIDYAHHLWGQLLQPGDFAVDATCGNGHDTLELCKRVLPSGRVLGIDIQPQAIAHTDQLLQQELGEALLSNVSLVTGCHSSAFDPIEKGTVKLIVYNLGYLPQGNKALTTQTDSTLASVQKALELIVPGGAITITCYPGHEEGGREERALTDFVKALHPAEWSAAYMQWLNRKNSPSLILLQKAVSSV